MKFTKRSLDLATKRGIVATVVPSDVLKLMHQSIKNSARTMVGLAKKQYRF
jgi:hypothetical protein